jgi:hypothetical protein
MQNSQSVWQQLKQQQITCEQALGLLVNPQGIVNLRLLDPEVSTRFWRSFGDSRSDPSGNRTQAPPVVPLLLWRNCYYLGSPIALMPEVLQQMSDRLNASIEIVPIAEKSYRQWCRLQALSAERMSKSGAINLLAGQADTEDLTEVAELHLSQVSNQIERIRTLIASALRNRASDIHLEPSADGLAVRFRIDGILRHVTTLPPDISRKVIVALKVMCEMDIAESRPPKTGALAKNTWLGSKKKGWICASARCPASAGSKANPAKRRCCAYCVSKIRSRRSPIWAFRKQRETPMKAGYGSRRA